MSIEKTVLEKLLKLPVEKQKEVLDFVETLEKKAARPRRCRSLKGLWADLGADVSPEDIAEARREMWDGFRPHNTVGIEE
ncbi:MAG TPA: hypothetical protein VI585_26210 [Candidatus Binatia bacterium]